MLAVFGSLYFLHKKKRFDGEIIALYGIIYSVFRFSIEFVRDDPRGELFGLNDLTGLSTSQIVSIIVATASVIFYIYNRRKHSLNN